MSTRTKSIVFVLCLAAIGGVALLLVRCHAPIEPFDGSVMKKEEPSSNRKVGKEGGRAKQSVAALNFEQPNDARRIFSDESAPLSLRFSKLMILADMGDSDAKHLAYQIQFDCKMWSKLNPSDILKDVRKPEMDLALTGLKAKCASVTSLPEYQKLAAATADQPRDAFDQDIRNRIRQTFADSGAQNAVSTALAAYAHRPDLATAQLIAETLGEMDVTNYNEFFPMSSSQALSPEYRQNILAGALSLLSCDYGVPCGPNSEIVMSLCLDLGVCKVESLNCCKSGGE